MPNTQVLAKATVTKKKFRAFLHDLLFIPEVGKFVTVTPKKASERGKVDIEVVANDILDGSVIKKLFSDSLTSGKLSHCGWGNVLTLELQ